MTVSDHLQDRRDDGKVQRRRLDKTAWVTGLPLVALFVAELWTWLDRRPGGTVSETVVYTLGDRGSVWYWAYGGALVAFLLWMAVHFVFIGLDFGWRQLLVLVAGFVLVGTGLWAVR